MKNKRAREGPGVLKYVRIFREGKYSENHIKSANIFTAV